MGTRADFYVGRGADAEWIGSIAWDGYPDGIPEHLKMSPTVDVYRVNVAQFLAERDDATIPNQGWPWPWETSATTDYAYTFDAGIVWASGFGGPWFDACNPEPVDENGDPVSGAPAVFPNMKSHSAVTLGKRSGVFVFGAKR